MLMTTDPGDLVLDPTCGSGTTAYVAEQWGRRWITIDTSRVVHCVGAHALMAGRYPYYLLADSVEGRKKEAEFRPASPPSATTRPASGTVTVRHQARLRLRTRAACHAQVHCATMKRSTTSTPSIRRQLERPARWRSTSWRSKKWEEWEIPRR
ncbi:MAG: site-specific DNA-methyltransferase [Desulfobacterales bacterium]|nr:site-specific DNA-methyltransferase [Desulfobacterales bacterium]